MPPRLGRACLLVTAVFVGVLLLGCQHAGQTGERDGMRLRVATFNTSMSRDDESGLNRALAQGDDLQARRVAEILQRVRPDIVLLQEFDRDPSGKAYDDFQARFLAVSQHGAEPIEYPYRYAPPVNTGLPLGADLNGDGQDDLYFCNRTGTDQLYLGG